MNDTYREIEVTNDTSVEDVMKCALNEFGLDSKDINRYRLVEVSLEKGAVHERTMDNHESPWVRQCPIGIQIELLIRLIPVILCRLTFGLFSGNHQERGPRVGEAEGEHAILFADKRRGLLQQCGHFCRQSAAEPITEAIRKDTDRSTEET